jgi:membrane protease YdiL (CAAX protease family)
VPSDHGDPPTEPLAVVTAPPAAPPPAPAARSLPAGPGLPAAPEPIATRPGSPWTFVDVFVGLGAVLLIATTLSAVIRLTGVELGSAALLVSALPVWIGLLGTAVWACRRHGTGDLIADLALRVRWIDLLIGLGAGLGLRFAIGIWTIICTRLTGQLPEGNLQDVLGGGGLGRGAWLVINALAIGLVGPVIEEIFFRGVGLRGALAGLLHRSATDIRLADPRRRARIAIAATAAVFALLHVSEIDDAVSALVLLPGLFAAGVVLGWLTVRTGRLGPAIVTHVVFNAVAVIALAAMG